MKVTTGFRARLRAETFADHQVLDDLFASVDLVHRDGLRLFAQTHHAAFDVLYRNHKTSDWARVLQEMRANLVADLNVLGAQPLKIDHTNFPTIHPIALEYILVGSRMGTAVLRKRWGQSSDPLVLAAGHYFSADAWTYNWRETCTRLSAVPTDTGVADEIVADTKRCFGLFSFAFKQASTEKFEAALG